MNAKTKFALLFLSILFSACSITPKYHSFGYHIEWKQNFNKKEPRTASTKDMGEKTREFKAVEQNPRRLKTPNADPHKLTTPQKIELGGVEVKSLLRVGDQKTTKQPQKKNTSSYLVSEFSGTSDTPITTKQLRKLAPNPPIVVKINRHLRIIYAATIAVAIGLCYCFFLVLDYIFYGNIPMYYELVFLGLAVGPILLCVFAIFQFRLFNKRQKILSELYVKNLKAVRILKNLDDMSYVGLLLGVIGAPIYHIIWYFTFKKLESLEPNNPYIELRKRKTKWNMAPGYLSLLYYLLIFLLRLFI
jgi:hypothetical protein